MLINITRQFVTSISKMSAPKIKLNNGYEMPIFGLGTYKVIIHNFRLFNFL